MNLAGWGSNGRTVALTVAMAMAMASSVACSGATDGVPQNDWVPLAMERGECDLATRLGGFEVLALGQKAVVQGSVKTRPSPLAQYEVVRSEGHCEILRQERFFCDPQCGSKEVCGASGCALKPRSQELGVVTVQGLGKALEISPIQPGAIYSDLSSQRSAIVPGEAIGLQSGGGDLDVFRLGVAGIDELSVEAETEFVIKQEQALVVEWDAPQSEQAKQAKQDVVFRLLIDQHGGTPATLLCEFEDVGTGMVPSSLIDQFMALGISGFPNSTLTRRSADHVEVSDGCVDLVARSSLEISVSVDGVTPCRNDGDCGEEQSCNLSNELCE